MIGFITLVRNANQAGGTARSSESHDGELSSPRTRAPQQAGATPKSRPRLDEDAQGKKTRVSLPEYIRKPCKSVSKMAAKPRKK